jgi:hypothetical protein
MNTNNDTPENWMQLGKSALVRFLRPLGIWLRDKRLARHVHRIWDTRSTNGQYWEMYAWSIGPLVIPFSAPRRNQIEEWTTPRVLALWKAFDRQSFRNTTAVCKNSTPPISASQR